MRCGSCLRSDLVGHPRSPDAVLQIAAFSASATFFFVFLRLSLRPPDAVADENYTAILLHHSRLDDSSSIYNALGLSFL